MLNAIKRPAVYEDVTRNFGLSFKKNITRLDCHGNGHLECNPDSFSQFLRTSAGFRDASLILNIPSKSVSEC